MTEIKVFFKDSPTISAIYRSKKPLVSDHLRLGQPIWVFDTLDEAITAFITNTTPTGWSLIIG